MVSYTHSMPLMMVAVGVSVVAAFTGLALTSNLSERTELSRKTLVSMSSFVIGGGIWTMHFLAMLANQYSVPVGYDVVLTMGSGLISILMVGVSLLLLHYAQRTTLVLNLAGCILATGIISMHYTGMSALRGVQADYSGSSIVLTALAGFIACVVAVRVAYGKRSRDHIIAGGLLLGLSVVLVHYTAMAGTAYTATGLPEDQMIAIANSVLAILLVIAVFVICGAFLLVSATFLTQQRTTVITPGQLSLQEPVRALTAASLSADTPAQNQQEHPDQILVDAHSPAKPESRAARTAETASSAVIKLPYEQNKKLSYVNSDEVGAIRADGRYTQLYTSTAVYLCPWSITETEKNLQGSPFYRSHRSYLVNVPRMSAFEKRRDSGVCLFEGYEQLHKVPVSRSRVSGLLERLGHA